MRYDASRITSYIYFFYLMFQLMKRGVKVNDVDSATGMSMLHYAVRATSLAGIYFFAYCFHISLMCVFFCSILRNNNRTVSYRF